jgi:hypothetical protein
MGPATTSPMAKILREEKRREEGERERERDSLMCS